LGNLGAPTLFENANHTLRASVRNRLYSWVQNDWHDDGPSRSTSDPEVFNDGLLYRLSGTFNKPASISILAKDSTLPELALIEKPRPNARRNSVPFPGQIGLPKATPELPPVAKWPIPDGFYLPTGLAATLFQSNLYLLSSHAKAENTVDNQHVVTKEKIVPQDGYHAALMRFSPDHQKGQKIYLKFADGVGRPPVPNGPMNSFPTPFSPRPCWFMFTGKVLSFGFEDISTGYDTGIWTIPLSEIDSAFAARP
jgi:hypothetical protein